jgi:hypothetical protein
MLNTQSRRPSRTRSLTAAACIFWSRQAVEDSGAFVIASLAKQIRSVSERSPYYSCGYGALRAAAFLYVIIISPYTCTRWLIKRGLAMNNLQKFALVTAFVLLASPSFAADAKKSSNGLLAPSDSQATVAPGGRTILNPGGCNGGGWGPSCSYCVQDFCEIKGPISEKDRKLLEGIAARAAAKANGL